MLLGSGTRIDADMLSKRNIRFIRPIPDMNDRKLAAVFIDFENFYYSLTNLYGMSYDAASGAAVSIIGNTLDSLLEDVGEFIIRQAFADWSDLQEAKRELQKMGIRIFDVLSTVHKNSADIELSLSVQEAVLTREDLSTIVVFAGDRDYMPIALRTKEKGRRMYFVGFRESLSGDLKKLVGEKNYSYVDTTSLSISSEKQESGTAGEIRGIKELDRYQQRAAEAALTEFDANREKYGSVKLKEFIVKNLAVVLPNLDHLQRKKIFQSLIDLKVLRTELRNPSVAFADSYPFTVFIVEEDNPIVKKLRKNINEGRELLLKAIKGASSKDGGILGSYLGLLLRKQDPKFSPEKYGCVSLSEFIERYPDVLSASGRKHGEDILYRVGL